MSEKQQRTAVSMREKMLNRYGDGLHHKHDKTHQFHRKHFRSHPVQIANNQQEEKITSSTGQLRAANLRKVRKRLDKGHFH